jgi:hypothetical protein
MDEIDPRREWTHPPRCILLMLLARNVQRMQAGYKEVEKHIEPMKTAISYGIRWPG